MEYGTTAARGTATPLDPALVTGHTVQLSGPRQKTLYYARVKSRDAAGNPAYQDFTFTTR